MAFANLSWVIGFVPCMFLSLTNAELAGEARLLNDIFKEYKREARPCHDARKPVQVAVRFTLTRLDELELRDQTLSTTGWLSITWKDEFLTWNPHHYDNLTKVNVLANLIWLPEIALDNSVGNIFDGDFTDRFRASIHHSGKVIWEPGGTFRTTCEMSINAYPFDHQTCDIIFANWQYTKDQVNLTSNQSKINMETYSENGEWEIEYTKLIRAEWSSESHPSDVYPEIAVTIHVRRRVLYYLINIMMPCVMMSLLVLVVFHLPPDSGEKVSLGVTVLLAFSVFQLMIAESVPTSSKSIPLIGIYLLFFMGESTFSVAVSVLVLNLHHRMEYKPPPDWLRKLVLDWMARVVFMRRIKTCATCPVNEIKHCKASTVPTKLDKKENVVSNKNRLDDESETEYQTSESKGSKHCLGSNRRLPTSPLLPPIEEPDINTCCTHLEHSEQSPHQIPDIQIHLSESKSKSVHSVHNERPNDDIKTQDKHYLKTCDSTRFEPGVGDHLSLRGLSPEVARSAVRLIKSIAAMDRIPSGCYRDELMTIIRDTYKELRQQRKDDEMDAVFENEWKRISKIVDRFFFMITLIVMIASTIVVFCIMPYYNHD